MNIRKIIREELGSDWGWVDLNDHHVTFEDLLRFMFDDSDNSHIFGLIIPENKNHSYIITRNGQNYFWIDSMGGFEESLCNFIQTIERDIKYWNYDIRRTLEMSDDDEYDEDVMIARENLEMETEFRKYTYGMLEKLGYSNQLHNCLKKI